MIPGSARLRVELPLLDAALLAELRARVEVLASAAATRHDLGVVLAPWHQSPPVAMHPSALEEHTDPQACADGAQALLHAALRMAAWEPID